MRGATGAVAERDIFEMLFQSTLPVRGATAYRSGSQGRGKISIHAPRAGSDPRRRVCNGRRRGFQSTLPVRGATHAAAQILFALMEFQSTLPVRGATSTISLYFIVAPISIHAPRAGSDRLRTSSCRLYLSYFNPRSPCGERLYSKAKKS